MVVLCSKEALEQLKNDPDWKELPKNPFKELYGVITKEDMMRFKAFMERLPPDGENDN